MTNRQKRIIAREFLIFTAVIITEIILFCFVFFYNSYQTNQIKNTEEIISNKSKSINAIISPINQKKKNLDWFFSKVFSEFDVSNSVYSTPETFWPVVQRMAKNDSTEYRWKNNWSKEIIAFYKKIGFENGKKLQDFILTNAIDSKDKIRLKEVSELQTQIEQLNKAKYDLKNKIYDSKQTKNLMLKSILILFGLLFILRYLIYAILWSISILKE